ncbi:MAG: choice-of-anchor L domain-containing protein [Flavobacterium sp.]
MKKILLSLILMASIAGFSQAITVNPNSHTPTQLVNNVLVNNSCLVQVTNPTATTGTAFGSTNGIAYYQNTNPAFNVKQSGVLLTTGQAVLSPGPNNSVLNGGNTSATWGGNTDLEAALASAGIVMQSKNATVLEFDFVPNTSNFGFDFLFASDEYGEFQCSSNDAFVVLLTQGSVTQNVALIPSTNTPITVSTIRNILYNSACPSANAPFFGSLNVGSNAASSPTNYNGQTVLMHASATLIPNVPYHIRFIIADDGGDDGTDGDYDSAVFIPAGSLNLGQKLFTQDLTVANGNALCFGQSYTINTNLDPDLYQFSWTRNGGAPIPGQTGPSLVVTTPGDYAVTLTRADLGCTTTQTIKIEYRPEIMAPAASNLLKCDNGSGTYTYDLSVNTPILKQGLDPAAVVTYHATQLAADGDTGALPTTYVSASGATIWARVELPNGCAALRSFQLLTSPPPTATTPPNLTLCESAQGANNAVFDLTQQNFIILNGQSNTENQILYFTSFPAAQVGTSPINTPESYTGTSQTIYVRIQKTGDTTCFAITQFDLVVKPLVVLPAPSTVNSCNSYTLPAIAQANYYTGTGGTGTMYTAGTVITTSQQLYIYAQTGGTPNCSNQSTVDINIINAATAPANVTACQNYTLPALTIGEYRTAPAGGGSEILAGTVITTTQTIYYFIPSAASCTQNNSFTVTITTNPVVTQPSNVSSCGPYTLPALPNGENYRTAPNGGGNIIPAGTQITATQTIYIYVSNPSNPACTAQSNFTVTVTDINVGTRPDRTVCGNYFLPSPGVGKYFTGPNGTGTQLNQGYSVTTTMTIYVYAVSPTDTSCSAQDEFVVTVNPLPNIPPIANVTACNSYVLPALSVGNYYSQANGGGQQIPAGTAITATQQVHAYAISPEGCPRNRTFTVTILNIVDPGDRTECGSYTLPALTTGSYYTGPNGTGTQLQAGANITTTQTIYIRAVSNTTPQCAVEENFTVTIVPRPVVATVPNVIACNSYVLPALAVGDYFTGVNGTGTMLPAGTNITTTQTIRIWAENPSLAGCGTQRQFTVTIINTDIAPADVTACASYTLPNLPANRTYRTAAAGGGTVIPAGTSITTSQEIYVYSPVTSGTNCSDDDSFMVTIIPQVPVDDPADQDICNTYTLPALTNGNYYTGPGGTGSMLSAGQVITSTQMIYVYNSSNAGVNCAAENSFLVQIRDITVTDLPDVTVCDGFTLPEPAVGKYYTGPNGTGSEIPSGTFINTTQTIYIYAATTTAPVCTDQEDFTVTIKPAPPIDTPANVGSCGPYTLPALTAGNYFTGSGGGGTALFAGQVITETTQLYIFAQTGGTPNCVAEHTFNILINPGSPTDVAQCDSYTLPAPPFGAYFNGPAGTGGQMNEGDVINATKDVYVFMPGTPAGSCMDNIKFNVTIYNSPVIAPVADIIRCDSYELPVIAVGQYHSAPGGGGTIYPAGHMVTANETIYIYAESATTPNCVSEESFNVTINYTPIADARSDVPACNFYDLQPLIVGTYWTAPNGPHGTGTQLFAGTPSGHITTTQTIYIYAETGTTPNCFTENSFLVEIFSIDVDNVPDAEVCDTYTFQPLTVGKYYAQPGGPSPSNPEILPGTVWTTQGTTTFYVYAETSGRLVCPDEDSFVVKLYHTPVIDETQGNVAQCSPFVLPAMATGTVGQYYTGPNGTGTVLAAGTQISTPQTVYVYASNGPNAFCAKQHSFTIDVNIVDVTAPADITICGVYTLPALAQGNYYTGPNGTGTQLAVGTQITSTQTIYVWRSAGSVPCTDQDDFTVTIITAPQIFQPDPLVVCGINDIGNGIFNLNPALVQALGGQPNTAVSIHETQAQATIVGGLQIANLNAYTNIVAFNQTLYIRVYSTVSDCFSIVPLQLVVNNRPMATEPDDLEVCDGEDGDGFAIFKLTDVNAQVLGSMSPAQFSVSFYENATNAEAGTTPITNPNSYNSNTKTVYVRVRNNTTGCYDVVPLNLIVNPLPVANTPTPYSLCDVTAPANNEREVFDLTTKIAEITGGATGVNVTFHTSMTAAIGDTGAITNTTAYTNLTTVQTLFVRVENAVTNCFRVVLMDLRVEPLPALVMPTAAETTVCDPDGDGFAQFDLQALMNNMLNGGTNIQVTFHETALDAQSGNNPIPNLTNYPNESPNQVIYIRAVNTITGCIRDTYSITLHVNPSPQVPDLDDIDVCDTDTNVNGETIVNLTQQNAVIQAALGTGLTIHYFDALAKAEFGSPRITNPSTYLATDGQEIWVRVTDTQGCFGIVSFVVNVDVPLVLTNPTPLVLCDNTDQPNDGSRVFDLTVKENEILGPFGVGQGFVLTYFVKNGTTPNINPITTPGSFTQIANPAAYTNPATANPQTLFVVATSLGGCKSFTTLTIRVLPNPVPDMTPDTLEECEDPLIGPGQAQFNLTQAGPDIRNGDTTAILTYYTTAVLADAGVAGTEIPNPTTYVSGTATIYVRMQANTGNPADPGCYRVTELPILVNPVPVLGDPATGNIAPYAICEIPFDGFAQFTLNSHIPKILIGQNAADYTVRFFRTLAAAQAGSPAMPNIYTNATANGELIYVRVDNNATDCITIAPLQLLVEPGATATLPDSTPFQVCDTDPVNDGKFEFDLTQVNPEVLNGQNPAQFLITYHESLADAEEGLNPIASPTTYTNTVADAQTIYVRVVNSITILPCDAITTIDIIVERLPMPVISSQNGSDTICVDFYAPNAVSSDVVLETNITGPGYTYQWFLGTTLVSTDPTYLAVAEGAYTVIVTGPNPRNCPSLPSADFTVIKSGPATIPTGETGYTVTNAFSENQTITVNIVGFGQYEYRLGNGPWQTDNVFTNVPFGEQIVTVRDVKTENPSCDPLRLTVSIIDYPNFFTPNGDGYNDKWNIVGLGSNNNNTYAKIYIFDRYGKLVKQIASEGDGWDGTFMGSPMPADDYWFTVEYQELVDGVYVTKEFKSHFSLKR